MQKIRLFFILFIFPFCLLAQQRTKIILQHAERGSSDGKTNATYLKKPIFIHEGATLTCDSAVLYTDRNVFEAFNNVHINQGDTINIFSDHLNYNGNTKFAYLTKNVTMRDNTNVLTTDNFTYNTGTQNGFYVDGGKIVSKDVTITSKNGYYLGVYKDTYFRYNVLAITPQSRITSDTMRYNTVTKITYFYGPTNIKGKDDNLYTENGAYNTQTEYAFFGQKNLYTNGSKSLKGDSLYYYGAQGYGKAVKNIVFRDTSDRTVLYGQLGHYYKADERAVVTKNAYVGMGTSDSIKVKNKMVVDSLWMGADTLETKMVLQKSLILIESPILKKDNELGEEEKDEPGKKGTGKTGPASIKEGPDTKKQGKQDKKEAGKIPKKGKEELSADSTKLIPPKDATKKDSLSNKSLLKDSTLTNVQQKDRVPISKSDISNAKAIKDSLKIKADDKIIKKADSIIKKTDPVIIKKADSLIKNMSAKNADSLVKNANIQVKKSAGETKKADSLIKKELGTDKAKAGIAKAKSVAGNLISKKASAKDSLPFNPLDTVRTRSIKAYHNVRVYKANMQAVADSLFYTNADSTLRWYGKPILWSQGSQQTGDTIYLRIKNKKLNTLQVLQNGFLVNVNTDSAKFNQVKGKLITAFFKDGELSTMFVDGNAESVYYNRDKDSAYTDMNQTVSSRIKILFKNKEISGLLTIRDPEGIRVPMKELKEDVLLTGFTWKPELRPLSKKEVISGKPKAKQSTKKSGTGKPASGKPGTTAKKDAVITVDPKNPEKTLKDVKNAIKETLPPGTLPSRADSLLKQDLKIDTAKAGKLMKQVQEAIPLKKQ